jgi:hypothetical protein
VIQIAKTIKNPKQGLDVALNALQKKNPQAANMIRDAIKSGKSPTEFAKEQAQNGNLNEKNLQDLKSYYKIAKNMGLPSVPEKDWNEIENAIKQNKHSTDFNRAYDC